METFRNNGIKTNWERLTDDEKLSLLGHTAARADRHLGELAHVVDLAAQDGLIAVDFGNFGEQTPPVPDEAA